MAVLTQVLQLPEVVLLGTKGKFILVDFIMNSLRNPFLTELLKLSFTSLMLLLPLL